MLKKCLLKTNDS